MNPQHKIAITPAILVDTAQELDTMLQIYLDAGFQSIDIDIQEVPFASDDTLSFKAALDVVKDLNIQDKVDLGWDIKSLSPESEVLELLQLDRDCRIYIYEGTDLAFWENLDVDAKKRIGLGIKGGTKIDPNFDYNKFSEIQLMSIEEETQGGSIDIKLLDKINQLRNLGFTGKIAVDGGINLNTAALIRKFAPDRVSVGSYFQAAGGDLGEAYQQLDQALNG